MQDVVFRLEIKIGNAAMKEVGDLAEALRKLADRVDEGNVNGVIRDENGNTVGGFRLDQAEEVLAG